MRKQVSRSQFKAKPHYPKWELVILAVFLLQIPVSIFDLEFSFLELKLSLVVLFLTVAYIKSKVEGGRLTTVIALAVEVAIMFRIINQGMIILHTLWFVLSLLAIYFYVKSFSMFLTCKFPRPTGPYLVGYQFFLLNDKAETEVAVFYPTKEKTNVHPKLYADPNQWVKQKEIMLHRLTLKENQAPPDIIQRYTFQYEGKLRMDVQQDAPLAPETCDAGKKVNAVIVSHGLSSHLHGQSILCKQLASMGYLVFSLQHNENIILEYERQKKIPADKQIEIQMQQAERRLQIEARHNQIKKLVEFIRNQA